MVVIFEQFLKVAQIFDKYKFGYNLGDFSQTHPVTL
jgi:hypothetical protein